MCSVHLVGGTSCFVHEGEEASETENSAEDGTAGDREMRDHREPGVGATEERAIDEVCVVVADKCWREGERGEGGGGMRERGGEGGKVTHQMP